jgi:hypothetical protein
VRRTLFGPRITVFTKDGRSLTKEGTGREFMVGGETLAGVGPRIAAGARARVSLAVGVHVTLARARVRSPRPKLQLSPGQTCASSL